MPLPVIRIERDKRQQINGGFKHIEPVAGSIVVKTVSGITAANVPLETWTERIQSPFMRMTGNAIFIVSDKMALWYSLLPSLDGSALS